MFGGSNMYILRVYRGTGELTRDRKRYASACMKRHQAFALPPEDLTILHWSG